MLNRKLTKTLAIMIAVGTVMSYHSAVLAHDHGHRYASGVYERSSYHIGVTGHFAALTGDDFLYATARQLPGGVMNQRVYIEPEFNFGWGAQVGYYFGGTGNDLMINFTSFNTDYDDIRKDQAPEFPLISKRGQYFRTISAIVDFDFKECNVELGQILEFERLHTRMHFGISYVQLDHDLRYSGKDRITIDFDNHLDLVQDGATESGRLSSDFHGFGPRVGFDLSWPFAFTHDHVSLIGHCSGALLYSVIKPKFRAVSVFEVGRSTASSDYDDIHSFIPATQMSLGLVYVSQPMADQRGFRVEAGWEARGYFHSIHRFLIAQDSKISNFVIYGGFLTLSYDC